MANNSHKLALHICIVIAVENMSEKFFNLLDTQKVDGDDSSLMCGSLP